MRAPSASACDLTHTTLGWTSQVEAKLAKPQSAPAMTFSRPTAPAKRAMRWAISLGVLDDVGGVGDDAGDDALAVRELDALPCLPFVLVARVGGLEAVGAGVDRQPHDRPCASPPCRERAGRY